jgi:hypothetical protein
MKRWILWGLLAAAVAAFVVVIVVPVVALRFLNGVLGTAPDYVASADDLDLLPLEGAVAVDGIRFVRPGSDLPSFVEIQRVIVTPHLGTMLRGERILDVRVEAPVIHYVVGPTAETSQTGLDPEWVEAVLREYPVTVDHLRLVRGSAIYEDVAASPDVSMAISGLDVEGTNLANLTHSTEERFARVEAKARVLDSGELELSMELAPYRPEPTFALQAHARHVPLVGLNGAFRAYGGFDVQAGSATVAISMRAADGGYEGKVEPTLSDVKLVALSEEPELRKKPFRLAWEAILGTVKDVAEIVSPGPKDQVRLPVELAGRFDGPSLVGNLVTILPKAWFGSLLHAFRVTSAAGREADRLRAEAVPIAEQESEEGR